MILMRHNDLLTFSIADLIVTAGSSFSSLLSSSSSMPLLSSSKLQFSGAVLTLGMQEYPCPSTCHVSWHQNHTVTKYKKQSLYSLIYIQNHFVTCLQCCQVDGMRCTAKVALLGIKIITFPHLQPLQ